MSTAYYIINEEIKAESDELNQFWDERLVPKIKSTITNYFFENQGVFITEARLKKLLKSETFRSFERGLCPSFWETNDKRIGVNTAGGFWWDNEAVYSSADITGMTDEERLDNLEEFLENNPEYGIYNEFGEEIPFEEFRELIEYE